MLSDRVSNPGPLTYESGALPIALRGLAKSTGNNSLSNIIFQIKCYHLAKDKRIISGKFVSKTDDNANQLTVNQLRHQQLCINTLTLYIFMKEYRTEL